MAFNWLLSARHRAVAALQKAWFEALITSCHRYVLVSGPHRCYTVLPPVALDPHPTIHPIHPTRMKPKYFAPSALSLCRLCGRQRAGRHSGSRLLHSRGRRQASPHHPHQPARLLKLLTWHPMLRSVVALTYSWLSVSKVSVLRRMHHPLKPLNLFTILCTLLGSVVLTC